MKISPFKLGWIGLRVERIGQAGRKLQQLGYMRRMNHAELNNRNAFDFVRPGKTKDDFDATNWNELSQLGLVGLAFWFTDAQWGKTAGLTEKQWQDRRIIELEFNAAYPYGKR